MRGNIKLKPDETSIGTRRCIETLRSNVLSNPLCYFSESDLQSELFALLLSEFPSVLPITNTSVWGTLNPKRLRRCCSRRVHSELLLPEGRIDVAVLDLEKVRLAANSRGRFGHIQLQDGEHIFIELKSTRTNRSVVSSVHRWNRLLEADIQRLNRYSHQCFLLCFDFCGLLPDSQTESLRKCANPNVELIYVKTDFDRCLFDSTQGETEV